MIVDGHVHLSDDPEPARGWPPFTADDLIAIMDEELPVPDGPRVIDRAAVMPMLGPTQRADLSFREQHRPVIEAVRKYPDRLVGTSILIWVSMPVWRNCAVWLPRTGSAW